jgi:hypothetical protein
MAKKKKMKYLATKAFEDNKRRVLAGETFRSQKGTTWRRRSKRS